MQKTVFNEIGQTPALAFAKSFGEYMLLQKKTKQERVTFKIYFILKVSLYLKSCSYKLTSSKIAAMSYLVRGIEIALSDSVRSKRLNRIVVHCGQVNNSLIISFSGFDSTNHERWLVIDRMQFPFLTWRLDRRRF